ncbi:sugar phosphate isomerase/epimerase family protein [Candidatus Ishikawella capsulata]|uniref:L-xylulose 5-phosphate 3-epimerase like protein n=1 Tax=Candidatus Ishikawaella capsulata Mpkobe TaxID=476281 RepID=C5WC49_9ENTR|nr:sugar phosphate isomerase/epimerase family protein [Candidatus Ishikawaella capsulata]BAH82905.1 L-xylulose 5-phosphate 3-epimerase like protein [Candidatus Ishikawaella capsulata Mpkobe]
MSNNLVFLNLVLLKGTAEEKLHAAHKAGFDQVEIWLEDIENSTEGVEKLKNFSKIHRLGFTNIQVLRDFTGIPEVERLNKRQEFYKFIDLAQKLGCNTIQAPATTREDCIPERINDDLCWLASEAARYKMRIMYEPMAWCSIDNTLPLAWKRIQKLEQPNIGLVVDLFHICALGGDSSQLDGIPADYIYEVQLCDIAKPLPIRDKSKLINIARHQRLLPGEGIINIKEFIDKLHSINYRGPIGLEVFNDKFKNLPPYEAAVKAWHSIKKYL